MIRPFSLRDLGLLRRLSDQGTLLHAESALTRSCQPLRGALFSMISRRDSATYVWREEAGDAAGFVQLYLPEEQPYAHLLCLGATPVANGNPEEQGNDSLVNEDAWLSLLEGAVTAVGERHIHSLIAEVHEDGSELPILRRAGFAVYTRQDIWTLEARTRGAGEETVESGQSKDGEGALLQLADSADEWEVEWLYANTVPPLIQLVEPLPPQDGQIWVLREDGELTAFVHIQEGPVAVWIQIFIHPNAYDKSDALVKATIAHCDDHTKSIYCCVRRYQSWLQQSLETNDFQRCQSQAVMVKHIAAPIQNKASELQRLLQAHRAQATSLLAHYGQRPKHQAHLFQDRVQTG